MEGSFILEVEVSQEMCVLLDVFLFSQIDGTLLVAALHELPLYHFCMHMFGHQCTASACLFLGLS